MTGRADLETFVANGVHIGGIYPFLLAETPSLSELEKLPAFDVSFRDRSHLEYLRRTTFDPERQYIDSAAIGQIVITLTKIELSNERLLSNIGFNAYVSFYEHGFGTVAFWADFSRLEFSASEVVELAALARGTSERVNSYTERHGSGRKSVSFAWNDAQVAVHDLAAICNLIVNELPRAKSEHLSASGVEFCYPIIYVHEARGCENSNDITSKYPHIIAGLAELWRGYEMDWLKKDEVSRIIETDFHPFQYGITCVSTGAAVEIHSSALQVASEFYGLTVPYHHYEERLNLTIQCEFPVVQLFLMKTFNKRLDDIVQDFDHNNRVSLRNPFFVFIVLFRTISIARVHSAMASAVSAVYGHNYARKSYIPKAIRILRETFGTADIEIIVNHKLADLNKRLQSSFSMLTAFFAFIIALLALGVALISMMSDLRAVGWL